MTTVKDRWTTLRAAKEMILLKTQCSDTLRSDSSIPIALCSPIFRVAHKNRMTRWPVYRIRISTTSIPQWYTIHDDTHPLNNLVQLPTTIDNSFKPKQYTCFISHPQTIENLISPRNTASHRKNTLSDYTRTKQNTIDRSSCSPFPSATNTVFQFPDNISSREIVLPH